MKFLLSFTFLFVSLLLIARPLEQSSNPQKTIITGKIEEQAMANLQLAYYLFDKSYVADSAVTNLAGEFRFENEYKNGVYIIYMAELGLQIPIIINNESEITLTVKIVENAPKVTIIRSKENLVFYAVQDYVMDKREKYAQLDEYYKDKTSPEDQKILQQKSEQFSADIKAYIDKTIKENTSLFVSKYLKSEKNVEPSACDKNISEDQCRAQQYSYILQHYFDNIDLSDERMIRTNFFAQKVDTYLDEILIQEPEVIIPRLDALLHRKEMHPEVFKTILISNVNKYAKSRMIGFDAIYVHLIDTYYKTGKATWIEEEQKQKMMNNADVLRPILIGKTMKNIKLTDIYSKLTLNLYDVKSDKVLLYLVSKPGKELSEIKKIAQDAEKGIKTLIVVQEDYPEVIQSYKDKIMVSNRMLPNITFITLSEENYLQLKGELGNGDFITFLLDRKYEILYKKFGLDQIDAVLDLVSN